MAENTPLRPPLRLRPELGQAFTGGMEDIKPLQRFTTIVSPEEKPSFEAWKSQHAPNDSGEDYDLAGAFKAGLIPDSQTGHWPDTFKKPNHPTFSNESIYAPLVPEKAGHWSGDTYIAPRATVAPRKVPSLGEVETPTQTSARQLAGSKPGVAQIKSPWARIPLQIADAIGGGLFPGISMLIPGTTLHHQMLTHQAQSQGKLEGEEINDEARRNLEEAQAQHAGAEAQRALRPDLDKNLTPFEVWHQQNPKATVEDWLKMSAKPDQSVSPFETWLRQNPESKVEDWLKLSQRELPGPKTPFEKWMLENPSATVAEWMKLQAENKPPAQENAEDQFIKEYKQLHPNSTLGEAQRAYAQNRHIVDTSGREESRLDRSYQAEARRLDTIGKPIEDTIARMSRLRETLAQGTPQADALVAPELLTVMAGGQGSGLRMNEAEISRIVGGRSNWESLRAAANKWSTDPSTANSITAAQRQQIHALVGAVYEKLSRKQKILEDARSAMIGASDVNAHRRTVDETHRKLNEIDNSEGQQSAAREQVNSKGEYRYTTDGGKTWHNGRAPKQ